MTSITVVTENNIIDVSVVQNNVTVTPLVSTVVQAIPAGLKGDSVNPADYFQTTNLFSELDNQTKKTQARQNLELQYIDCGEFN
jgi:hypothetical protein